MVETITPVVHGGRRGPWARDAAVHLVGAAVAAAAFGAALGGAGAVLGAPWGLAGAVGVAAVAVAYALRELTGIRVPIPERRRQVPEWWRRFFSPPVASFLYGAALGIGFLTFLRYGTLVAVSAVAVASGDPMWGAAVMVPFGIARTAAMAVVAAARAPDDVSRVVDRLERLGSARIPGTVNGVVLVGVAAAAILGPSAGGGASSAPVVLLAVLFGWAAAAKVVRPAAWRAAVEAHELPGAAGDLSRIGVPAAEAVVPLLVVAGRTTEAAGLALGLVTVFSLAVVRLWRRRGLVVPCGCFGRDRVVDVRLLLARNLGVAALAAFSLARGPRPGAVDLTTGLEVLPAILTAVGVALAVLLLRRAAALRAP
jgi:hypothetical protein